MKPIQTAIEALQAKNLCPRLHVDVTHADAVCPDFVREKWKEQLVIDLDPSYPLDLAFTKVGVEADLSFGGYVTRCTFPWAAIYVVADRSTGRGQVFAGNIPESKRAAFGLGPSVEIDPELTKVRDESKSKKGSRRRKRPGAEPEELAPVAELVEAEAQGEQEKPSEEVAASVEQTAQTRRAGFRVIEGGG